MSVDLTITSTEPFLNATVKGTLGTCTFPSTGLAPTYVVTATEYPQLGPNGSITVFGATTFKPTGSIPGNVKLLFNGFGLLSATSGAGLTFRQDLQAVTLDAALFGGSGQTPIDSVEDPAFPIRARITGWVRCT